jgi:hypothetical protein
MVTPNNQNRFRRVFCTPDGLLRYYRDCSGVGVPHFARHTFYAIIKKRWLQ